MLPRVLSWQQLGSFAHAQFRTFGDGFGGSVHHFDGCFGSHHGIAKQNGDVRRRVEGDVRRSEEGDDVQGLFEILSLRWGQRHGRRAGTGCTDGRHSCRQLGTTRQNGDLRRRLEGDVCRSEEGDDVQGLFEVLSLRRLDRCCSDADDGADDDETGETDGDFDDGRGDRRGSGRGHRPVQGRHLHDVEDALRFMLASRRRREVVLST
jgi:hypothetical protein